MSATEVESLVIVGGCGHVGLPLGIAFADSGLQVVLYDHNSHAVETVNAGKMPFMEPGADEALARLLGTGRLIASTTPDSIADADAVIVVIGTPVGEHFNPDLEAVPRALGDLTSVLRDGQLVVLRSTVYPGVTAKVDQALRDKGLDLDIAFCPERIAEGRAMTELFELPQIVSGMSERARFRASQLFSRLTSKLIHLEPEEAELAKLFTNTWRYVKFAVANQMYMIANDRGLDFERIRQAVVKDYPRAADLPRAGFAAGPCLFKDTMQLAAFHDHDFTLGHAAMMVNEGLPLYVVSRMAARWDLATLSVGILGMAFKAESDDARSSLSYKLKRILEFRAHKVLTTDPYVTTDPDLLDLDAVLAQSDVLVIAAPHRVYHGLTTDKPVIDIWGTQGRGVGI